MELEEVNLITQFYLIANSEVEEVTPPSKSD